MLGTYSGNLMGKDTKEGTEQEIKLYINSSIVNTLDMYDIILKKTKRIFND